MFLLFRRTPCRQADPPRPSPCTFCLVLYDGFFGVARFRARRPRREEQQAMPRFDSVFYQPRLCPVNQAGPRATSETGHFVDQLPMKNGRGANMTEFLGAPVRAKSPCPLFVVCGPLRRLTRPCPATAGSKIWTAKKGDIFW